MYPKIIALLYLLLIKFSFAEPPNSEFFVVSTTESAQNIQQPSNTPSKCNNNLESSQKTTFPRHCREILESGNNKSGLYVIRPEFAPKPFMVLCNMDSQGGGWTYFLNRFDASEDFNRTWADYRDGFGNLAKEFWLGLDHLHQLTGYEFNELLIEMVDFNSKLFYAHYDYFSIGNEKEGYVIKLLGNHSGDAGDGFSSHAGSKFTTRDYDQDRSTRSNCAASRSGAWWYVSCADGYVTGKFSEHKNRYDIIYWPSLAGPEARMMVRPKFTNK